MLSLPDVLFFPVCGAYSGIAYTGIGVLLGYRYVDLIIKPLGCVTYLGSMFPTVRRRGVERSYFQSIYAYTQKQRRVVSFAAIEIHFIQRKEVQDATNLDSIVVRALDVGHRRHLRAHLVYHQDGRPVITSCAEKSSFMFLAVYDDTSCAATVPRSHLRSRFFILTVLPRYTSCSSRSNCC